MGQVTDALRSSGLQLFFFNLITITLHRLLLLFKCHKQQAAKTSLFLLLFCLKAHRRCSGGKEVFSLAAVCSCSAIAAGDVHKDDNALR